MANYSVDMNRLRHEAERDYMKGAIIESYKADRAAVLKMLDQAFATEWICVLRYLHNAQTVDGIHAESVAKEFREHAADEQEHALLIGARIKQLGGKLSMDPSTFAGRGEIEYREGANIQEMLKENLIAERIAIESYGEMIRLIGDSDPTTRRLFERILEQEEEHADDLVSLLTSQTTGRGVHFDSNSSHHGSVLL